MDHKWKRGKEILEEKERQREKSRKHLLLLTCCCNHKKKKNVKKTSIVRTMHLMNLYSPFIYKKKKLDTKFLTKESYG